MKLGLPKGSLQEAALAKMAKAGFNIQVSSRSYIPYVDDEQLAVRLIRAQEISRYVAHGLSGLRHHRPRLGGGKRLQRPRSRRNFIFSKATSQPARWVLAVPEDSPITTPKDLQGKRIATEVVNITKRYLRTARRQGRGRVLLGRHRGQGP